MKIKIGDFGISKQLDSYKTQITKNKALTNYYASPEILNKGIYNQKSDIWSIGCIIYELFNLSIYFNDKISEDIKKINSDIYNKKWQRLIDSLLQTDYQKRFDINQINQFLINELNIYSNIIIGEIYIKREDVNKDIRIINSCDNVKRMEYWIDRDDDWEYENEKEIEENIEIKINRKMIKFTYYYKFKKEGKYIIEYSFKNNLTKTYYMFRDCNLLTYLDLSNFNTQNVNNMKSMFSYCKSLTNLNLSNFNAKNITNMSCMFFNCNSLTDLNLSNFNAQNCVDMSDIFYN